jgi:dihydroorotate dehydrogenase
VIAYIYGAGLVVFLSFGFLYVTDTRASIHQWLVVPALRLIHADPEEAHHAGARYVKALYDFGLHPRERGNEDQKLGDLKVEVFGHVLDNPVGTSAGIDKNAEIPDALMALGPAVVEVGGITPLPQPGNPKPRVFRIPSQNALINRYGLNSEGAEHAAMQLRERVRSFAYSHGLGLGAEAERIVLDGEAQVPPGSLVPGKLLAVQVAKNKTTPDGDIAAIAKDYTFCVEHLAKYADILVVNVSSPNTPGLRDLQATGPLTTILSAVVKTAKSTDRRTKPAVMVKVSPDEDSDAQVEGICAAVWASGVDGVIVGNTTNKRPDTIPKGYILPEKDTKILQGETGGYSGPQMFERTLNLVKRYRSKLDHGPPEEAAVTPPKEKSPSPTPSSDHLSEASIQRDTQRLKPEGQQESQQPLIQIPDRNTKTTEQKAPAPGASTAKPEASQPEASKVIFATGGITNGEQCLQILNAGASVCQVYTAMMYGGVGTITRMKGEMRAAIKGSTGGKSS